MKKLLLLMLALALVFTFAACAADQPADDQSQDATEGEEPTEVVTPENPVIRLSTTTSVNDSGLLPYLQPTFEAKTGYKLEITSNGTGAAIKLGESGDADCLLVPLRKSLSTAVLA